MHRFWLVFLSLFSIQVFADCPESYPTGTTLRYTDGSINFPWGSTFRYSDGVLNYPSGSTFRYRDGTMNYPSGSTLKYSDGSMNHPNGSILRSSNGDLRNRDGDISDVVRINIDIPQNQSSFYLRATSKSDVYELTVPLKKENKDAGYVIFTVSDRGDVDCDLFADLSDIKNTFSLNTDSADVFVKVKRGNPLEIKKVLLKALEDFK